MKSLLIGLSLLALSCGVSSLSVDEDGSSAPEQVPSLGEIRELKPSGRIFDLLNGTTYGVTIGGSDVFGAGAVGVLGIGALALLFLGGILGVPLLPFLSGYEEPDYYYSHPTGYGSDEGYSSGGANIHDPYQKRTPQILEPIITAIDNAHHKYEALKRRYRY